MRGSDAESIKKAGEELTAASHKIAEELYKKTSAKPGPDGGAQQSNAEEPVDAEYKVEDENK